MGARSGRSAPAAASRRAARAAPAFSRSPAPPSPSARPLRPRPWRPQRRPRRLAGAGWLASRRDAARVPPRVAPRPPPSPVPPIEPPRPLPSPDLDRQRLPSPIHPASPRRQVQNRPACARKRPRSRRTRATRRRRGTGAGSRGARAGRERRRKARGHRRLLHGERHCERRGKKGRTAICAHRRARGPKGRIAARRARGGGGGGGAQRRAEARGAGGAPWSAGLASPGEMARAPERGGAARGARSRPLAASWADFPTPAPPRSTRTRGSDPRGRPAPGSRPDRPRCMAEVRAARARPPARPAVVAGGPRGAGERDRDTPTPRRAHVRAATRASELFGFSGAAPCAWAALLRPSGPHAPSGGPGRAPKAARAGGGSASRGRRGRGSGASAMQGRRCAPVPREPKACAQECAVACAPTRPPGAPLLAALWPVPCSAPRPFALRPTAAPRR